MPPLRRRRLRQDHCAHEGFRNHRLPQSVVISEFDKLAEDVGIEKIKTIGDNYMAVCGVPTPRPQHASMAAKFALDMIAATARLRSRLPVPFTIRVGLHSGPVMAGVIGTRKFAYDVWGDTVNIAARMEAASEPSRVLASMATVKALGSEYLFDGPHKIDTKEGRVLDGFFVKHHLGDDLASSHHKTKE
jgi:adenylate cyclase